MSQEYEKALFQTEKELVKLNLLQAQIKNEVAGLATRKQVEDGFENVRGQFAKLNERLDSWIINK